MGPKPTRALVCDKDLPPCRPPPPFCPDTCQAASCPVSHENGLRAQGGPWEKTSSHQVQPRPPICAGQALPGSPPHPSQPPGSQWPGPEGHLDLESGPARGQNSPEERAVHGCSRDQQPSWGLPGPPWGGGPHPHRLHLSSKDPGRPGAPMPHPWQPGPPLSCMPPPLLTLHHQPTAKSTQGSRHLPIHTRHGPWFPGPLWPPLPRPPELLVASALCHQLGPMSGIPDPTDIRLPHRLPAHHLPGPEPHTRRHCGLLRGGLPQLPDPQKTHL